MVDLVAGNTMINSMYSRGVFLIMHTYFRNPIPYEIGRDLSNPVKSQSLEGCVREIANRDGKFVDVYLPCPKITTD